MKLTVTPVYDLNVHGAALVGTIMRVDEENGDEIHVYYGYQIGTKVAFDSEWDIAHSVQMMLTEVSWVASIEEAVSSDEPVQDDTLANAANSLPVEYEKEYPIKLTPDGKHWNLNEMDIVTEHESD